MTIAILLAGSFVVYVVGRLTRSKRLTGLMAVIMIAVACYLLYVNPAGAKIAPVVPMPGSGDLPRALTPAAAGPASIQQASVDLLANFEAGDLGLFLTFTAAGLALIVAVYSIGYMGVRNIGKYYALLLMMTAGMIGIGLANDLFNMFVMFELMSLSSFALVAFETEHWEPVEAGVKYLIMSAIGSMVALLGITLVFIYTGTLGFDSLQSGMAARIDPQVALIVAALLIGGFGVKAAIVPMHTWLPDAHSAAPSGISAMLSGIVISAGLITMIKALMALGMAQVGMILALFAVITMFVGNFMAWVQTDLKRMLAYSSIAHMGYILVGVGVAFAAPAAAGFEGMRGGLFHILNHAVMKGGAFLCAGAILTAVGTRDLDEMAGIGGRIPLLGICFGIFVLALVGTPPFNGFISKLFICKGALLLDTWGVPLMVLVIVNSVLSLFYYIPAMNKVLFGSAVNEKPDADFSMPATMAVAIFALALLTLLLGIAPDYGLDIVDPAARAIERVLQFAY